MVHPRREALIEVAGGGVERAVECPAVPSENVAGRPADMAVDVDGLEAALRGGVSVSSVGRGDTWSYKDNSGRAPGPSPTRGAPGRRKVRAGYLRCLFTSLVISNMLTVDLPPTPP